MALCFGHRIRPEILFVVFETNPREAYEFLQMYAGRKLVLVLVLAALPLLVRWVPPPTRRRLSTSYGLAALALGAAALLGLSPHDKAPPLGSFLTAASRYRTETAAYYRLKAQLRRQPPRRPSAPAGALHVLVLGESTARNHMSLYGYPRRTNPELGARDDLLVFTDVISRFSHTQAMMRELFTLKNQEAPGAWHEHPTLLETLNAAGWQTIWVSNQEMYGLWSNVTSALASQAEAKVFHKHRRGPASADELVFRPSHDGELMPVLERILESPSRRPRLLVVHLMGTHGWYPNRYPRAWAHFRGTPLPDPERPWLTPMKRKAIDFYDDAVRYNDHVVHQILRGLEAAGRESWLLYLSDHGEELYDSRDMLGHSERVGNRFMVEVPFLLWLSPSYRARRPTLQAAAAAQRHLPFMTDDLPHVVLDLAGAHGPPFEPARSPVNPAYDASRERRYAGKDYDCELREPPKPDCQGGESLQGAAPTPPGGPPGAR